MAQTKRRLSSQNRTRKHHKFRMQSFFPKSLSNYHLVTDDQAAWIIYIDDLLAVIYHLLYDKFAIFVQLGLPRFSRDLIETSLSTLKKKTHSSTKYNKLSLHQRYYNNISWVFVFCLNILYVSCHHFLLCYQFIRNRDKTYVHYLLVVLTSAAFLDFH